MTASPEPPKVERGPACYRNWRAQVAGAPVYMETEFPLYSDAKVTLREGSALQLGPYVLVNAHPRRSLDPALLLVVHGHLDPDAARPERIEPNTSGFTGTWPADEIAALLSLLTGARLMSGGPTRQVKNGITTIAGDGHRPIGLWDAGAILRVVPQAFQQKEISPSALMTLPNLPAEDATALVRAARSYRDGLWLAESEADLTWLLFVSALEVAAVQQHIEQTKPIDILRRSKASLVKKLQAIGGQDLVETVAESLKRELRATGRFLDFMRRFMPPPPEKRPPEGFRLDWSEESLNEDMQKIYDHRSRALHDGLPFPAPMCMGPLLSDDSSWEAPQETILGQGARVLGGAWDQSEMPFPLYTFEHIARGALLKWWDALADKAQPRAADGEPREASDPAPASASDPAP